MDYDIAVIGGGPAGLMAAGRAGQLGAKVVLLEKNSQLGIKLLMTGGGRCNLTNQRDNQQLAASFGRDGRWLLSGLSHFGPEETIAFFNQRGLATRLEDDGRIFPASDKAQSVLQVLIDYLSESLVDIQLAAEVKQVAVDNNKITKLLLVSGQEIRADKFIICSGGQSYPTTGSTGRAYEWLRQLGHRIIEPRPALVPIILKDRFIQDLEGLSLPNVEIKAYHHEMKICSTRGPVIFTAAGLSGPAGLNISRLINRQPLQESFLRLDLLPDLSFEELDQQLRAEFGSSNKALKTGLGQFVPGRLAEVIINILGLTAAQPLNSISRFQRRQLVGLLKEFNLAVSSLAGYEQAMITAGGVDLAEVDQRTMQSKIISNLYLAGELLNLDGPTGGYNLQLCWTTGYLAGQAAMC